MKKHILRTIRSHRTQITGLALAAILAVFPAGEGWGTTYNVGSGKPYSNLEALRDKVVLSSGDVVQVFQDDKSLLGPFNILLQNGSPSAVIRSDGETVRTITYAGLKDVDGRFLDLQSGSFTFGANLIFTGSDQRENGGVGRVRAQGKILTDGSRFIGNHADGNGGAFSNEGAKLDIRNSVFRDNNATFGGILFSDNGASTMIGATVSENRAEQGGAVYLASGGLTITDTVFDSNTATADGGALHLAGGSTILTNVDFSGNQAAGLGTAVYVTGSTQLGIIAEAEKSSTWDDGKDGNGPAILYFDLNSEEGVSVVQKLSVHGAGTIRMNDAMQASKSRGGAGSLSIDKWGTGTWILSGDNIFGMRGTDLTTTIGVTEGVFELSKAATIQIGKGSFALTDGATLVSNGVNTIDVLGNGSTTALTLQSGTRIELNMNGMTADDGSTMLELNGRKYDENKKRDVTDVSIGTITIDVTAVHAYAQDPLTQSGTYTLVHAEGADFSGATLLIEGEKPVSNGNTVNDRVGSRSIKVTDTKDTVVLVLDGVDKNRRMTWTGTANSKWSEKDKNWNSDDTASKFFLNGDTVVFGTAGAGSVVVDKNGVTFDEMIVQADYVFSGGDLSGNTLRYEVGSTATFDTRSLTFGIEVNKIKAGLVAVDDGVVTVTVKGDSGAVRAVTGSVFTLGRSRGTGEVRFVDNENTLNGGAISGDGIRMIGGVNSFDGNTSSQNGGAIYANTVEVAGGAANFTNNTAKGLGGAIYAEGNVSLAATNGNIVFQGNTHGASGAANAIYMANGAANTLQLTTAEGQSIVFYDPVENTASPINAKAFAVNIGGEGTVKFDTYRSNIRGKTTVNTGTLALANGAVYGATAGNVEFSLKSGAVLQAEGKRNKVTADTIRLENNSTIRIALENADNTGAAASLTLDGTLALPTGRFNLDAVVASRDGVFKLLSSSNVDFTGKFNGTVNGIVVGADSPNDRYGTREFVCESGLVYLNLKGYDKNRSVTWSGGDGNVWSEGAGNWIVPGTNKKYFLNGDSVLFDDTSTVSDIEVAAGGVLVAGMKVNSGNYTFEGGDISQIQDGNSYTLDKSGQGVLTLNQRNVFDRVNVKMGTLAGGNSNGATIVGDLVVGYGAKLSPGSDGPAAFGVDGDIDFQSGSFLFLDLGRTVEKSDQLLASGAIDFASDMDGTVTIVVVGNGVGKGAATTDEAVIEAGDGLLLRGKLLDDGRTEAKNDQVTIRRGGNRIVIQSDGSLDLQSAVVSDSGTALAINAIGSHQAPPAADAFTWNQMAALASIENASINSFANQLMAKYALQDDNLKRTFLEQILPTINSAMPKVTQRAVTQFRQVTFERLRNLNAEYPSQYDRFMDGERLRKLFPQQQQNGSQVRGQRHCANAAPIIWLQNYGDFMHQRHRTTQGYYSDAYGIAMGTERWTDQNTVVGLGFGGAFASVKTDDRSQKADANTFVFSPYVSHTNRDGYKIMASIGYAYNDYEITRHPGGTAVTSSHNGNTFLLNGEVSKKIRGVWTDVTPFAGMELIYLDEEDYVERNAAGTVVNAVRGEVTDSFIQTLGLRFGRTRENCFGWLVSPAISLAWLHDYGDATIRTVSNYAGGTPFVIQGSSMNRDRFALGLNYNAVVNSRISFFGGYNGEYATRFGVHTVQAGFTFEF